MALMTTAFLRRTFYWLRRYRLLILTVFVLTLLDMWHHTRKYNVMRPKENLDSPFSPGQCVIPSPNGALGDAQQKGGLTVPKNQAPPDASEERENAAIVMLARNSDMKGAVQAVKSLEKKFNKWFHYPYVFLNDGTFTTEFQKAIKKEISSSIVFRTIPAHMWSMPSWVDREKAYKHMDEMGWGASAAARKRKKGGALAFEYAAQESYHHMCRFQSGFFYDVDALKDYRWYWRIEPDVEFTCDIPYDPFRQMATHNKTYGYTVALWEVGSTAPSLFRTVSKYYSKHRREMLAYQDPASHAHESHPLSWTAMHDASWAPWPVRNLLMPWFFRRGLFHSRNSGGDVWNFCHFWSNFEVADLEFFRSKQYRDFFEYLDRSGGFYYERWGDAPVHSLAASLMLRPEQLHHFSDVGYYHPPFQNCPVNGQGCRCDCDVRVGRVPDVCVRRLREAVEPEL